MLLVRTTIGPSAIQGIGLFAAERIPAGTVVWRFAAGLDLDLDPQIVERLPEVARERLAHYGYLDFHLNRLILSWDDARFMNHSDDPNTRNDYGSDPYGVDVALRDIEVGEEITTDYRTFERAERPRPDRSAA